jgi:hypothetical protein
MSLFDKLIPDDVTELTGNFEAKLDAIVDRLDRAVVLLEKIAEDGKK